MKTKYIILTLLSVLTFGYTYAQVENQQDEPQKKSINLGLGLEADATTTSMSVATAQSDILEKQSKFSPSEALYGLLPGLQVMQGSGFNSTPSLALRGSSSLTDNSPLVLVDGFERNINFLAISEIENITILKDAAAATLYGVQGANGVIMITTKRGSNQKLKIQANYNFNVSTPYRMPEMADAVTYAESYNQALANDGIYSGGYSDLDIEKFATGASPYTHPNVNWIDEAYNDASFEHRAEVTAAGGNEKVQFFSAFNYQNIQGLFKPTDIDEDHRYDSQIGKLSLNVRSNIDAAITKTTKMSLGILARITEQNQPNDYSTATTAIYSTPSAAFPVYSPNGNFASTDYYNYNPVALIGGTGTDKYISRSMLADLRLTQDLSMIADGLYAQAAVAYDVTGEIYESISKTYAYDVLSSNVDNEQVWTSFSENSKLSQGSSANSQDRSSSVELKVAYDKTFAEHDIKASAIYRQTYYEGMAYQSTQKRQGVIGYVDYNYDNRYVASIVANYTGSAVMPDGDRFIFYPALSAGWIISNESFMSANKNIDLLKLRASAGVSGWDGIDHALYTQYYSSTSSYLFNPSSIGTVGYIEDALVVEGLTYERNTQANIGVDFVAFNSRLSVSLDAFYEHRDNMLVTGSNDVSSVIGVTVGSLPIGEVVNRGVEVGAQWGDTHGDFSYRIGGNFSFVRNEIIENGDIERSEEFWYLDQAGSSIGARWGLEAIGFFESWEDIQNSPTQNLGDVRPGDIKYKDQNGDGEINQSEDLIQYGYSGVTPEIYYGFNIDLKYKRFGLYAQFQGCGHRDIYLSSSSLVFPLYNGANISEWYLSGEGNIPWTEETAQIATLPRLTTESNANNFVSSTVWYRNGAYFKLRNLEVSYDVPSLFNNTISSARVFVRGANLFSLDYLKDLDPENYWVSYPAVRTYSVGVNLTF